MRCPVHMDQAWEYLSCDTSLQAWSPASGSELKWAGDQKKSCPLRRALAAQVPWEGREGRVTDWFSLLAWEPAVIFYHPIQPNQAKLLLQHSPTTVHRPSSVEPQLSQLHSVSYNWVFLSPYSTSMFVSWLFLRFFSQTIPLLARAAQNFNPAFQGACSPPSHFLFYVNLTTPLSTPSVISIMKTVSITKARTDPWGISLTPVLQFNSKPRITTLTSASWNAVHPRYRPANETSSLPQRKLC